MTIKVLQPGIATTIQDLGRYGVQQYGIIVSGAMDPLSTQIANLLVGNPKDEGTLEIALYGSSYQFQDDHLIAITGANLQALVDGKPVPMWRPVHIKKGAVLEFNSGQIGTRTYLAIAGGFDIPVAFKSKSTYIRAGIGGYQGRPLKRGDIIQTQHISEIAERFIFQLDQRQKQLNWSVNYHPHLNFNKEKEINVIKGSEYDKFSQKSQEAFTSSPYTLSTQSDRMGYNLKGKTLELEEQFELLSEGVTFGTIQVPSSGQPIILMADRQTTGGYPKIGNVVTADLPTLAQSRPNHRIKFKTITLEKAEEKLLKQKQFLKMLEQSILAQSFKA